ncbi:MAG: hypothetical protein HC941_24495, partial [Microcoleus sp. SU_5_3]|nr:hypothetical protein [Microcoleus sp. SU_5_3]
MTLKPLGLKDSLIPPISLGQKFESLRSPPPLGQSLTPLGQSLQPLGDSVLQPLPGVNGDWEIGNWQLDVGTQQDAGNVGGEISTSSDYQLPIRSQQNINLKAGETPTSHEFLHQSITNYQSENESLSPNTAALNSSNAATDNIAQLKPLGRSKPLVQESENQISSLSGLLQFTQSTSSAEELASTVEKTSNLSNSTPTDTVDISTNVSPIISAKPVNSISESESLNLPNISRFDDLSLGFNKQLISRFITEPLPQLQTSFPERLDLDRGSSVSPPTTTEGEVEALAPSYSNLIQAKTSPVSPQEITSPQVQKSAENPADLAAQTGGEVEAIAPTLPNVIQSKTLPDHLQKLHRLTP